MYVIWSNVCVFQSQNPHASISGIKVIECGMIVHHYHLHIVFARLAFSTIQRQLCISNSNFPPA